MSIRIPPELASLAVPIESVQPFPGNPHRGDVKALRRSLRRYGQKKPILVWAERGWIVAGNSVYAAMVEEDAAEVAVISQHMEEAEARGFLVVDNRMSELGENDPEALARWLADLTAESGIDDVLGYTQSQLNRLLAIIAPRDPAEDEPVPVPTDIWVERGCLYRLGEHRLLCGDATSEEDVTRLLAGSTPPLMITDPPYGVDYHPERRRLLGDGRVRKGAGHNRIAKPDNDHTASWLAAWRLFPGDIAYVWHASLQAHVVVPDLVAAGFDLRGIIIWAKPNWVWGRGNYKWQHEPCAYLVRHGETAKWAGGTKETTVWTVPTVNDPYGVNSDEVTAHSNQKPLAVYTRPILNHEGDAIYDPFVGSGTAIIAAEQTGRRCYAMDINPVYAQMSIERWERYTGHKAERLDDV